MELLPVFINCRGKCNLSLLLIVLLTASQTSLLLPAAGQTSNRTAPAAPALIGFGDSIIDPGNNNGLFSVIKADFPPYGMDFPGHVPTGRFCNGRIPTDILASKLGIKDYVPAYLGTDLSPEELLTGVSFASGGSGFDPLTPKVASVLSMDDQLNLYTEYRQKLVQIAGEERTASIISDALFAVCSGTDDIANTYFTTPFRKLHYDIASYVDLMVDSATNFIEKLTSLGAMRIGVVGLPPIGCVPSQRTLAGGIARECEPTRNAAAQLFNSKMAQALETLHGNHPGTVMVFLEIYDLMIDMIERPSNYGLDEIARGCCGTGKLEVAILCNKFTPVTCPDPNKFMFWDSYHPTQRGYEIISDDLFRRYSKYLTT